MYFLHNSFENNFQNEVDDCIQAINYTLEAYPLIDKTKIALVGNGFGATVALNLNLMQNEIPYVNILSNPIGKSNMIILSVPK